MSHGPKYNVAFKRRINGKTDYHMRQSMILSKVPRLVSRCSLKHVVAQLVESFPEGDKTSVSVHSKELTKEFGWNAPCGNIPAAYLTGFLLGRRALSLGIKNAILDIGLQKPSAGSRIFAVLKGAMDAGLEIPCDSKILPDDTRTDGGHIISYAKQLLDSDSVLYERRFSQYLSKGLRPEECGELLEKIKNKIDVSIRGEKND
ncbi:MAG: large subunit ribosomal protein [Thermoproteota archaeon]|nr:large subunit ribosomal protein [Thermoproteota archaeon]